jgi:hypothetical protein
MQQPICLMLCMMTGAASAPSMLLALPDPCLLAVLQHCADSDQKSVFSAARAHSRLRAAATEVLRSITAVLQTQQQADGVLSYIQKYGKHMQDKLVLRGGMEKTVTLYEMPLSQLSSLHFQDLHLQLPPFCGYKGMLWHVSATAALKQLQAAWRQQMDADSRAAAAACWAGAPQHQPPATLRRHACGLSHRCAAAAAAPHLP